MAELGVNSELWDVELRWLSNAYAVVQLYDRGDSMVGRGQVRLSRPA